MLARKIILCLDNDKARHDATQRPGSDADADKNFWETLDHKSEEAHHQDQQVYTFALVGNSTLYYPVNKTLHTSFLAEVHNMDLSYGMPPGSKKYPELGFKTELEQSAPYGHGCIHHAGRAHGAIHTAPDPHPRIVVVVHVGSAAIIEHQREVVYGF